MARIIIDAAGGGGRGKRGQTRERERREGEYASKNGYVVGRTVGRCGRCGEVTFGRWRWQKGIFRR